MTDADRELCERLCNGSYKCPVCATKNGHGYITCQRPDCPDGRDARSVVTDDTKLAASRIEALNAELAALKQQKLFDQDYYERSQTWAAQIEVLSTEKEALVQAVDALNKDRQYHLDRGVEAENRNINLSADFQELSAKLAEAERERDEWKAAADEKARADRALQEAVKAEREACAQIALFTSGPRIAAAIRARTGGGHA